MKLLVIDTVNYIDYPTGGVLAFYRTMLPPCGNDLILVGSATDDKTPVGEWSKRTIDGIEYDFYTLSREVPNPKKPIIPGRFDAYFKVKKHIKKILSTAPDFDFIFTQSHEVLTNIPNEWMRRTCFVSPGVSNPLSISRYPWARRFAKIYDKFYLMPKVAKVKYILAAADRKSIEGFAGRSGGLIKAKDIIPFPTRYNDEFFKVMSMEYCREQLDINKETAVFVTVGRLNWFKGWKLMIDSYCVLNKKINDTCLLFIGDGEDETKIKQYADDCGIAEKVKLVGKKSPSEISIYLNAANAFIMGSFMEGWSTTLVEACACGVPCVVTDFSSASEMITDGKNGFVIMERNPELFAEKMGQSLYLDRNEVIEYDKQFQYLSQSKIKEELEKIIVKINNI